MWATDLHNHMPLFADYRGASSTAPRDIVAAAVGAGVDLLAVTDHLSIDYVARMRQAAAEHETDTGHRLGLLPGLEFRLSVGGVETHLVVLLPWDGIRFRAEELFASVGISPATLDKAETAACVFDRDPLRVAEAARDVGGLVHLAQVDRYFGATRAMDSPAFDRLASEAPLSGIDIVDPANAWDVAARAPGLALLHSSDSHSPAEIGRRWVHLDLHEATLEALEAALKEHAGHTVEEAVARFGGSCTIGEVREAGHPGVKDPFC